MSTPKGQRLKKTHWGEGQRTACGLKMKDVPLSALVIRPSKLTCLHCKAVIARRRRMQS